jgi:hypothetical protein
MWLYMPDNADTGISPETVTIAGYLASGAGLFG